MINIDKNIPMPKIVRNGGPKAKYPFADMQVGDSFEVTDKTTKKFASTCAAATRRLGSKFTIRTIDNGIRVWRIV